MLLPTANFRSGSWRGVVRADCQDCFADLDAWLAQNPGELIVKYDSREVRRLSTPLGTIYLKRIFALTDAGLHGQDLFSALKWYCRPSRAIHCWKISRQMLQAGFACCEPLLAVRRRLAWGRPEDLLITSEVKSPDLRNALPLLPAEQQTAAVRSASRQLRQFHQAGFVHGDCLLRNLSLADDGTLIFLDNDRTKRPSPCNLFCTSKRNLAQFGYSLRRCLPQRQDLLPLFFQSYFGPQQPTALVRHLTASIERRLAARLAQADQNAR